MEQKILITGATGNVGMELIQAFSQLKHSFVLYGGVRNPEKEGATLKKFSVIPVKFDFTDPITWVEALQHCDILFLLRPPQLANVNQYFKPLIQLAVKYSVKHIVFLSVQGVQHSSIIPHHKIEKLILKSGIPYTFLRPAYFMQNFSGTLKQDLQKNLIYLPAGEARFTLVDVSDIGRVGARILCDLNQHINKAYDLTSRDLLTFSEMAIELSRQLNREIKFVSPNLLSFFIRKRREHVPTMLILVMIMLHYFPRFQSAPPITDWVAKIKGESPISFSEYVSRNKGEL